MSGQDSFDHLTQWQDRFMARITGPATDGMLRGEWIYHHAYQTRLKAALAETYERLRAWLGDDDFDDLASDYVARQASYDWSLDSYGAALAELARNRFDASPEVAELAWLDRALHEAFSAADRPDFDRSRLTEINWAAAKLYLHPSVRLTPLTTNAAAIWVALSKDEPPPAAAYLPEPACLLVWRQGLEPKFRTLDAAEGLALRAISGGARFSEMCDQLARSHAESEIASLAGAWLSAWLNDGLISDIV